MNWPSLVDPTSFAVRGDEGPEVFELGDFGQWLAVDGAVSLGATFEVLSLLNN